jgi:16S rRNA G966 N2-methylase RsmD
LDIQNLLRFVNQYENEDINKLAFKLQHINLSERLWIINQIICRRKLKEKITCWNHKNILLPHSLSIQQCSSQLTALFKAQLFPSQEKILDLTMGLGVDAYHFALHHQHVTCIEYDNETFFSAKHNFEVLNVKNISIINCRAEDFINKNKEKFNIIYLDPSRRKDTGKKAINLKDCLPNVTELFPRLIQFSDKIILKLSPLIDILTIAKQLTYQGDVYAVSINNECKEVLFVMDKSKTDFSYHAVELNPKAFRIKSYPINNYSEEITFSEPEHYIYLPHSSILKLGRQNVESEKYGLKKLAPHSHIYTSTILHQNFFGRIFKVIKIISPSEKELKQILPDKKISIISKNFPLSSEELKNNLQCSESDNFFGIATTLYNNKKVLIITQKMCVV